MVLRKYSNFEVFRECLRGRISTRIPGADIALRLGDSLPASSSAAPSPSPAITSHSHNPPCNPKNIGLRLRRRDVARDGVLSRATRYLEENQSHRRWRVRGTEQP